MFKTNTKSKAEEISSEEFFSERPNQTGRLDLNDLLKRNKMAQIEDKKTNLLIISLAIFVALVVVLVLSFT